MSLRFTTGGTMKLRSLFHVTHVCLMKQYMSQAAFGNATAPVRMGGAVGSKIWET